MLRSSTLILEVVCLKHEVRQILLKNSYSYFGKYRTNCFIATHAQGRHQGGLGGL